MSTPNLYTFVTSHVAQVFHVALILLGVVNALLAYYGQTMAAGAVAIVITGTAVLGTYVSSPTTLQSASPITPSR